MDTPLECINCLFRNGVGRCSFARLVSIGLQCGCVVDYSERPKVIRLRTRDLPDDHFHEPEEAHTYLCNLISHSECAKPFAALLNVLDESDKVF